MTKKYIITDDKVIATIEQSSDNPVKSSAIYTALDGKVDKVSGKQLSTEDFTSALKTKLDGIESGAEVNVQADWTETTTTADAYIANKPFVSIGSGLTVTSGVLSADVQLHFQIFETLPTPSATYAQTIALVLKTESETGNLYKEYACVDVGTTSAPDWKWEQIGETKFELTISQTAAGITINNTDLQSATASQKGLLTAADFATFNGKQDVVPAGTAGEVLTNSGTAGTFGTSIGFDTAPTASSTNLVKSGAIKTELDKKVDIAQGVSASGKFLMVGADGNVAPTAYTPASPAWGEITGTLANQTDLNTALAAKEASANKVTAWSATTTDVNYPSEKLVKDSLDAKLSVAEGTFTIGHDTNGFYLDI